MSRRRTRPQQPARGRARRTSSRKRTYRSVALALSITSVGLGIVFWRHGEAIGSGGTRPLSSPALARSGVRSGVATSSSPGSLGPEGVTIPAAPALAGPGRPALGARVDGISCGTIEQLAFHVHAHLTIFVSGQP